MYDVAIPTPPFHIRFTGVWDMQDLYECMVNWFRMKKYKFQEKNYKHKHPSPFGVERQYVFDASKEETEYISVNYTVYMHEYDAHDVEVTMKDGSKRVFTQGRLWAELKVEVRYDPKKRWNENKFFFYLKDFYNKYIILKRFMEGYAPKFRTEVFELHALMRERLYMEHQAFGYRYFGGSSHRKSL